MLKLRRSNEAQCYFCNTLTVPPPRDRKNFRCTTCGCWNRYDADGEILSDEPAMHEESLNSRSFSKRASPSKDRLPTSYGNGPFCHDCQTNQHLIVNLLSNYLPPLTSLDYEQKLEMLPQYGESLHARYPVVCSNCLPAVEDEIRKKDTMARSQALGGWLKETRGKVRQRRVSATLQEREKASKEILAWRVRGCLWGASLTLFLTAYFAFLFGYRPSHRLNPLKPAFPILVLISVLWTAWDPTYASVRGGQMQGRDVRVKGKQKYNVLQMITWSSRLVTATLLALQWFHIDYLRVSMQPPSLLAWLYFLFSLLLEISVSIVSFMVLRLQQPPLIRLLNEQGVSRSPTPSPAVVHPSRSGTPLLPQKLSEPDLFASLSLSSRPVVPKNPPVFGLPSLTPAPKARNEKLDEDAMDWSPTNPNPDYSTANMTGKQRASFEEANKSLLRPQKFFAPEKPTGLESLFEKTRLADDVSMNDGTVASRTRVPRSRWQALIVHLEEWCLIYFAISALLMGISLTMWISHTSVQQATLI
ncbi:hypothetical protein D9757_004594 [Collybiopsis confluens]|uniref:Ima1 N-terminal domain-containing protein n=1 Tax=Collybiopsis confluens TaxID=2823264 RepID=A0A8H5HSU2_9AGAR|nr:hypothetical protein D9757_004594 [Collybiopsis confluens]